MSSTGPAPDAGPFGTPSSSSLSVPTSPLNHFSMVQPSPASTYGDSNTSDAGANSPRTPCIENNGVLLENIPHLTLEDEKQCFQSVVPSSYSANATKSKVNKGSSTGTEHYSPPFVRNGTQSRDEDPFRSQTPSRRGLNRNGSSERTPKVAKSSRKISENWRSNSSSNESFQSSSSHSKARRNSKNAGDLSLGRVQVDSSLYIQEHVSDNPNSKLTGYTAVKAEDAQSVYPPSCCVFVANLLQSENEEALQMAVTQVFREYGPVFVKIRRDAKHMPFAFCQYTSQDHAEKAIREGRGRLIKGRACRCEKAKAHRLFFVERKYGSVISPVEVRELLQQFGNIELCYTASHVERTALNLNEGVIVQFEMYDEGQDAQSALRNHDLYKMQAIAGLGTPARTNQIDTPVDSDATRAYLARYEVDRRSIFVGNLPLGTTETEVAELFEHYGHIEEIILRESASKFESQDKFCFAFVQFRSPIAATNAIATKNVSTFGGKTLRVSQKDSENSGSRSRGARGHPHRTSAPAIKYQSRTPNRIEQQISPVSKTSPPGYNSPYAYAYNPFYSCTTGTSFTNGQGLFYTAPQSSAYYPYAGNPSYDSHASGVADAAGSPNARAVYYGYGYSPYQYQYTPAPYWALPNEQQTTSPVIYHQPAYSPQIIASGDRSTTPTPAGQAPIAES